MLPLVAVIIMSKIPLKTSRPGSSWVPYRPWSSGPLWVPHTDPGHQESHLFPSNVTLYPLLTQKAILEMNSTCELLGRLISIALMNLKLWWAHTKCPKWPCVVPSSSLRGEHSWRGRSWSSTQKWLPFLYSVVLGSEEHLSVALLFSDPGASSRTEGMGVQF